MANIRASVVVSSALSVALAVGSVSATAIPRAITAQAVPNTSIAASIQLIPLKEFERQIATVSDTVNAFRIEKYEFEIALATDSVAIVLDKQLSDSVTVSDVVNKLFISDVDFDLSDPDVDTDPITVSDQPIISIGKGLSDTSAISESNVKNVGKNFSETLQSTDQIFTIVGKNLDDSVAVSEVSNFSLETSRTDSVATSESHEVTFTKGDISEAVGTSDLALLNAGINKISLVTANDNVNSTVVGKYLNDTVTITELFEATLVLGQTTPLFDFVSIADDKYLYTAVPGTLNNHMIHQPLLNGEFVLTTDPNAGIVYAIRPEAVSYTFGWYGINENQFN